MSKIGTLRVLKGVEYMRAMETLEGAVGGFLFRPSSKAMIRPSVDMTSA